MSNTYNSYKSLDDLPEKLEVRDDFKEIYNVMEYSKQKLLYMWTIWIRKNNLNPSCYC